MRFLLRHVGFLIILILLVSAGLAAGINLVRQESLASQMPDQGSIQVSTDDQPQKMVTEEPFITVPSGAQDETANQDAPTQAPKPPSDGITASAYIVGDLKTGKVYLSQRSNEAFPVASISKLVTAIVGTNMLASTTTIQIASTTYIASLPADVSGIHGGESYSLTEILKPLLLASSNIAAEAIASTTDRDHFLELMSNVSWEIGMPKTFFGDPSGLDPDNVATANDLFTLTRYLYGSRQDLLAITRIPHAAMATTTEHDAHSFDSTHPFVTDPRFIGGKTGRTPQAGETMITLLNIDNDPVAFIVLHSAYGQRKADTDLLIKKFLEKS
jgi:D-alanyl-D-alanine carboxypeptidase